MKNIQFFKSKNSNLKSPRRPFQNHAFHKRLSKTQNGNINLSAAATDEAARGSFTVTCLFSDVLYFICCVHCFMCQTAAFRSVPITQCVRCQQTTFEICILHTSWVRIKVDSIIANSFHMPIAIIKTHTSIGKTFTAPNENKLDFSECERFEFSKKHEKFVMI